MSVTFTIRAARFDEVEAVAELLNEHSQRLHGVDSETPEDLRLYWESPEVDFDHDVLVAEGDGSLVGYADLGIWGEHVWLDVRGVEADALPSLLAEIEARASERKPGAHLLGYANESDDLVRDAYERAGYQVIRHSFRMEIDLDAPPPEPQWPEGVSVRTMQAGEERRVYEAHMESFADAWMFAPQPFEHWRHWFVTDTGFDPTLWYLAEAREELAGILISKASGSEPGLGWVRILGVVPAHRRQGIAQALLQHAFCDFWRRGFRRVGLGVDAQSPTGAVRLYERAGMHVARTSLQLEKVQE